jgi:hypothetical protein
MPVFLGFNAFHGRTPLPVTSNDKKKQHFASAARPAGIFRRQDLRQTLKPISASAPCSKYSRKKERKTKRTQPILFGTIVAIVDRLR